MNKNAKAKKNEKLRELLILVAVIVGVSLILSAVLLIPSCKQYFRDKDPDAHEGAHGNAVGKIVDDETGITYLRCPAGIGANTLDYVYLTVGKSIDLYKIDFEDPKMFISEAKNADFGSFVYRAENVPELTLTSFEAGAGTIHKGTFETGQFHSPEVAEGSNGQLEDGTKYVKAITEALAGKEVTPTGEHKEEDEFEIRLLSKKYQGLYYRVDFFTDENGIAYLQDMVTGKIVLSPDMLTVRMIG